MIVSVSASARTSGLNAKASSIRSANARSMTNGGEGVTPAAALPAIAPSTSAASTPAMPVGSPAQKMPDTLVA
jgi:hypothetical protein